MNKRQLINQMALQTGLSKADVESCLHVFVSIVQAQVARGNEVQIINFGKFYALRQPERKGINPKNHQPITIPAKTQPRFKAGKGFQARCNK